MKPSEARKGIFTTPLQNDFQWYNLYRKMFGVCTYAPPMPMNPSTTTTTFPKRKHIQGFLDDYRASFEIEAGDDHHGDKERTLNSMIKPSSKDTNVTFSRQSLELSSEDNSLISTGRNDSFGKSAGEEYSRNASVRSPRTTFPHSKSKNGDGLGKDHSSSQQEMLNELLDDCGFEHGLFNSNFFDFLKRPCKNSGRDPKPSEEYTGLEYTPLMASMGSPQFTSTRTKSMAEERQSPSDGQVPSSLPPIFSSGVHSEAGQKSLNKVLDGTSFAEVALSFSPTQSHLSLGSSTGVLNVKHSPSEEILVLQRDTWALLMDHRAISWIEREAQETGKAAAQSLRRLLEIVTGPLTFSNKWFDLKGVETPRRSDAERLSSIRSTDESNEIALQRVYEGFAPFFAIISVPGALQRLQNQYNSALRAQIRGLPGLPADIVGMPLFSQYATWKEAFENRKAWSNAPMSYFLIHDASFNYAQICALFSLLQIVQDETHQHTERCLEAAGLVIALEAASYLLIDYKGIRMAVEDHLHVCPLLAIQETTEDVLLAYEQSSARNALTMALYVCDFITDCALDPETASNFVSSEALKLHSAFKVPGTEFKQDLPDSPGAKTDNANKDVGEKNCGLDSPNDDSQDKEYNHASGNTITMSPDATSITPEPASTKDSPLAKRLRLLSKRFNEADFESIFDLIFWFTDAATVHSGVPVDPLLLPRDPEADGNATGTQHSGKKSDKELTLPNWIQLDLSISSLESTVTSVNSQRQTLRKKRPTNPHGNTKNLKTSKSVLGSSRPQNRAQRGLHTEARITSNTASTSSGEGEKLGPVEPLYIPGRYQRYHAASSLLEAITSYEACLQTVLNRNQRTDQDPPSHRKSIPSPDTARTGKSAAGGTADTDGTVARDTGSAKRRRRRRTIKSDTPADLSGLAAYLSPSTTLLKTPLIFVMSYIRLHGAVWLKQLFERLFNILRKESVLLYVNTLDLSNDFDVLESKHLRRATVGAFNTSNSHESQASTINNVIRQLDTSRRNENSFSVDGSSANVGGLSLSTAQEASCNAHVQSLEDLICQDILYVMNEFFSALYGSRSTSRLPRGITALITQFTTTVHLHLLQSLVNPIAAESGASGLANNGPGDSQRSGLRRVSEYVRHLKLSQVAVRKGMLRHHETLSNSAVKRLVSNIEQNRLAKFILFDCWIICTLNNVISYGHLDENASLHLRWNIDAFARYLKILVNAPFIKDKASSGYAMEASKYINSLAEHVPGALDLNSGSEPKDIPKGSSTTRSRKFSDSGKVSPQDPPSSRGAQHQKREKPPPVTMSLPCFITGVYDIATGNLVRLGINNTSSAVDSRQVWRDENSVRAVSPFNRSIKGSKNATPKRNSLPNSSAFIQPVSASQGSKSMLRERNSLKPTVVGFSHAENAIWPPAAPQVYTIIEGSSWDSISPYMKALNEALGIVGYDMEEDSFGDENAPTHVSGSNPRERVDLFMVLPEFEKADFNQQNCAMRLLDYFTRRACQELSGNIVMTEFELLPSIAARCVDKLTDIITGQHPLIVNASSLGVLPNTFGYSPYLASLHGTLLHPKCAAQALDNVSRNSRRFFDALIRPLKDGTILQFIAALTLDQTGVPMVDSNAVLPLMHTNAGEANVALSDDLVCPRGSIVSVRNSKARASRSSLAHRWEAEARRLSQQHGFLTTGAMHQTARVKNILLNVQKLDPMHFLKASTDFIFNETNIVPLCFDPWWRIMVVALCFKVSTLLSECSSAQSEIFFAKCREQMSLVKQQNRQATKNFISQLGKTTEEATKGKKKKTTADRNGRINRTKIGMRPTSQFSKSRQNLQRK